jgi:hypothetical protein
MTRQEALAALQSVADAMTALYAGSQPDRLNQLTSHLATAAMATDCLFDQAENEGQG